MVPTLLKGAFLLKTERYSKVSWGPRLKREWERMGQPAAESESLSNMRSTREFHSPTHTCTYTNKKDGNV